MSRFSNPFIQYSDGVGVSLPGAQLFFFEPGTTTPKDTFSDSGLTIANTNPVVADSTGRMGDIWLDGIYKVVLKDAAGVTQPEGTKDPVGDTTEGQFELWLNDNTYNIPDIVLGSDDEHYRSLTDANQGNNPTSSAANWEQLNLGRVWNANVTYEFGGVVEATDGRSYRSIEGTNLNNDPTTTDSWVGEGADIQSVTATVAASALTVGVKAGGLDFRSTTLGDGVKTNQQFNDLSLVVPSGATLGTVNAIPSRIVLLVLNNAGTTEPAVVNLAGGVNLDETTLISTTAIDATADSDNVIYSTTARSNVAFRVVGVVDSTQATAGTWDTTPSLVQGAGGESMTQTVLDKQLISAWVNFNGTTIVTRDSQNVSSITDLGVGHYGVNFATDMVTTNYCATMSAGRQTATSELIACPVAYSLGQISLSTNDNASALTDGIDVNVMVTRG